MSKKKIVNELIAISNEFAKELLPLEKNKVLIKRYNELIVKVIGKFYGN